MVFLKKGILVSGFLSTILFSCLLVISIIVFSRESKYGTNERTEEDSIHTFRFMRYHPTTKTTNFGTVTSHNDFRESEFSTSKDKNGVLTLISNFGSTEYICTGTCYCEEEDDDEETERRGVISSSTIPLARNYALVTLVAAFTAIGAMEASKDVLEDECEDRLTCSDKKIIKTGIRVDDCVEANTEIDEESEYIDEVLYIDPDFDPENPDFFCEGSCLYRFSSLSEEQREALYDSTFFDMFRRLRNTIGKFLGGCKKLKLGEVVKGTKTELEATEKFITTDLQVFCEKASHDDKIDQMRKETDFGLDDELLEYSDMPSHCVGHINNLNKRVSCYEMRHISHLDFEPEIEDEFER